jgi:hypothetical protein
VERSLESVTDNPPPMRPYSDLRVAKYIGHVLLGSLLASIPFVLLRSCTRQAERQREEQEQLQRHVIDLEKAGRQGNPGEAARRLLGIRTSPQSAPQKGSKAVMGSGSLRGARSAEAGAAADRPRD